MKNTGVLVLLRHLFSRHPWRMAAVVGSMAFVSLIQGLGMVLLVPLLSKAGLGASAPSAGSGFLLRATEALFAALGLSASLRNILFFFLLLVVFENLLRFQQMTYVRRFVGYFAVRLRLALYEAYLSASWPFWLEKRLGEMASRLTLEAGRVESALWSLAIFLSGVIGACVYLAAAFALSWPMALLYLIGGGTLLAFMETRSLARNAAGAHVSSHNNALQEVVMEHLGGAKMIKASGALERSRQMFERVVSALNQAEIRGNVAIYKNSAWFGCLIMVLLCLGFYSAVVYFQVEMVEALVVLFIFFRLSARLSDLQQTGHATLMYTPAYAGILQDLRAAEQAAERPARSVQADCPLLKESVRLEDVSFSYREGSPVLKGVSLSIPAGKTVALAGKSGCGKSTLLDILAGLLRPGSGRVLVDGVDLQTVDLQSWRSRLGYVGQESVLFFDTVAENLRWANPRAAMADMERAARLAHAHEFIQALPKGYDTPIGNRGTQLSGGERQRLALARALLSEPRLLLLDEATSSLDAESESKVQAAIDGLRGQVTMVLVAHRLATLRNADWICVLDEGRIAQQGTWEQLAHHPGPFQALWALQTAEPGTSEKRSARI